MAPTNFSGLILDGFDLALTPESIIGASPAVRAVGGFREIQGVTFARGDDEQSGGWIETWRTKVGCAAFIWRNQAPIGRRVFIWIRNGTAVFIYAIGPVHLHKWHGKETLSIRPVQDEVVTVP